VKAASRDPQVQEVPVRYRRRVADRSKISGSFTGSIRAGFGILYVTSRARLAG